MIPSAIASPPIPSLLWLPHPVIPETGRERAVIMVCHITSPQHTSQAISVSTLATHSQRAAIPSQERNHSDRAGLEK